MNIAARIEIFTSRLFSKNDERCETRGEKFWISWSFRINSLDEYNRCTSRNFHEEEGEKRERGGCVWHEGDEILNISINGRGDPSGTNGVVHELAIDFR